MKTLISKYSQVIRRCSLFADADESQILQRFEVLNAQNAAYEKDAFLHHAGEELTRFGMVLYGRVKVMIDDIEGNTAIMAQVTPGNTFGESLCFLKRENPDVYIQAAENCGVIWFSTSKLFGTEHSACIDLLERHFVEMITQRTLAMNQRIQILSKVTLREKLITFFTFALSRSHGRSIDISMTREEMALYMGTNRSALSRELSHMKSDGLIDYSMNHFSILF